jgi:hypothetical protein
MGDMFGMFGVFEIFGRRVAHGEILDAPACDGG